MNSTRFELNSTYAAGHSAREYLVHRGDVLTILDINDSTPVVTYGIQNGQCYFRVSEAELMILLCEPPDDDTMN